MCSDEVGTRPYFHWEGAFTRKGILIGARGLVNAHAICFFESQAQCKIASITKFDVVVEQCNFQRIRVVGFLEVTWHVDPHPSKVDTKWDLWVHEGLPLHMVKWDPGEYEWLDPFTNKREPLLQYTVKLGRHILSAQRKRTNGKTIWQLSGLTESFLNGVWKGLWETSLPAKVTAFRWLVMHDAISVGSKLHRQAILNCQRCGQHVETQRHALWDCIHACRVWMLILRLVSHSDGCESFCWGSAVWGRCGRLLLNYDVAVQPSRNEGFVFDRGKVLLRTFHDGEGNNMVISNVRWEYVSGFVLWAIWKARCIKVFQGVAESPAETIKVIWPELLHTLRGQWNSMQGNSGGMKNMQIHFGKYVRLLESIPCRMG